MIKKTIHLCADDFGLSDQINQGILQLLDQHKLSAVSCMSNYPDWQTGAVTLRQHTSIQVGLHFNFKTPALPALIALAYTRRLKPARIREALEKQYALFVEHFGRAPDFIDGHQHIHQLPVIRDVLLDFYASHLQQSNTWIRSTRNRQSHWKARLINHLGGRRFDHLLKQNNIPHNPDFSGIYTFSDSKQYANLLEGFIDSIEHNGLIMCHPGLEQGSRHNEFSTLMHAPICFNDRN